jgi:hypothetical protein
MKPFVEGACGCLDQDQDLRFLDPNDSWDSRFAFLAHVAVQTNANFHRILNFGIVIPAKAGIQTDLLEGQMAGKAIWIPARAALGRNDGVSADPRTIHFTSPSRQLQDSVVVTVRNIECA